MEDGGSAPLLEGAPPAPKDAPGAAAAAPPFVLSSARYYVMSVYFLACVVQGVTWTPLSALPDESARVFPGLSTATIFWSLNLGPILYIPLAPFAACASLLSCLWP